MSTPLVEAIDRAVGYIRKLDSAEGVLTLDQLAEFSKIADEVYTLAYKSDLHGALPQTPELRPELESSDPPLPPVQFVTKLNLPGDWNVVADKAYQTRLEQPLPSSYGLLDDVLPEPPKERLVLCVGQRWYHDLQVLRELAATANAAVSTGEMEIGAKDTTKKRERSATVNERMAAMVQRDPNLISLTAKQWATKLGNCSDAAVKQTHTWKVTIRNARILSEAGRMQPKNRRR